MILDESLDPGRPDPEAMDRLGKTELPSGWRFLELDERKQYRAELLRELPMGHILCGVPVDAIARKNDRDDFLFVLGGQLRLAYVHLTWSKEVKPSWPSTEIFVGFDEWKQFLIDDQFFDDEL